ncbi:MAG TPA: 4Fe-4S dicluster domain-containing protein [Symbiobacteriaceae bacterium]|nr:4Fe-4S dicluster domain-containing protein [Symbiobacteriaceae bacterium]
MAHYAQEASSPSKVVISRAELGHFVEFLLQRFDVYGPVAKGKQVVFGPIADPADLKLDYTTTILPAKKFFYEPFETLFHYHRELGITEQQVLHEKARVLFGLHSCDVAALGLLDRVFDGSSDFDDPDYRAKREQTLIVALNCNTPGEHCFCTSFGTGPEATKGYDLVITDLGDRFFVEAANLRGQELLDLFSFSVAGPAEQWEKADRMKAAKNKVTRRIPTERLPRLINQNFDHPYWNELKEQCLSCGACTVVCPTCYCFNVWDRVNLDLTTGERKMVWDSCQLVDFGEVAMGHNFRKDRTARVKQRIYHKLSYFSEQYGQFGCVGCGRCTDACTKHIDLVDLMARIGG